MSDGSDELITYFDALDAAFPSEEMSEIARSAATYDFMQYVRKEKLSLTEATTVLRDEAKVSGFREIGLKVETYITGNDYAPNLNNKKAEMLAEALVSDINVVKLAVERVAVIGDKTNEIFAQIEKKMSESGSEAVNNKKLLHEIRGVAEDLKQGVTSTINSTKNIMPELEAISSQFDEKLQTLDTGVKKLEGNTDPGATRRQNIIFTTHSVIWGAIASTLLGVAATVVISYNAGRKSVQAKEETTIPQRIEPQKLIMRDGTGKVWELQFVLSDEKTLKEAPKPVPKSPLPPKAKPPVVKHTLH